ncbi:MAG: elongation factor P [Planctomycetes bacterium]|nr:elongation factor P [Planctomycetota bacterium]
MSIINATEIRKGIIIKFNNELYEVAEYNHVAPGNWRAMVQAKLRNIKTGSIAENRFRSTDRVEVVMMEAVPAQYSYQKGKTFVFMNSSTYEEIDVDEAFLRDKQKYLLPDEEVMLQYCDGELLNVQLPITVNLKITQTAPALKTATITNVSKPATLETGLVIQVPAFVQQDEVVKVDTRDGRYIERVG